MTGFMGALHSGEEVWLLCMPHAAPKGRSWSMTWGLWASRLVMSVNIEESVSRIIITMDRGFDAPRMEMM